MAVIVPTDLRREIASVERNIFHPFVGRLLLNEDGTLVSRGGMLGLRLYDDLERDGRVFSVMQKRKLALGAYPWKLDANGAGARAVKLVERALQGMNFIETYTGLMDAILKGFAVGEVMWEIAGGEIMPRRVIMRDQRRFRFDIDYQLHLLTYDNMLVGEALPPRKFIVHSSGSKDGSPYGLGLGTRLFWPVFFKRQDIGFWLAFLDKYGMPTAVGKYPSEATAAEKDKLRDALDAIAQDTGIAIPESMIIELLQGEGAGQNDGYEKLARYMDEQIAEIVLGETLTTNIGDVGSKAAAGVHNDVRLELTQADAELLAATLNLSIVRWVVDLNMPGSAYPLLSWEVQQPEDLTARATRDQIISNMGYKPTLKYITETYGGEWTERAATLPPGAGDEETDAPAAFADPRGERGDARAALGAFAERLGIAGAPTIAAMVAKICGLVDEVSSIEELRDRLIDLYPGLDAARFAEAMQEALVASELMGRAAAKIA